MNLIDKKLFDEICGTVFSQLKKSERLTLQLNAEETLFVRVNNSKIRQTTDVVQGTLNFDYYKDNKTMSYSVPISANKNLNQIKINEALHYLRLVTDQLPEDPYLVEPKNNGTSINIYEGKVPTENELLDLMLGNIQKSDVAGLYAGGRVVKANANHLQQSHWFETSNFYFDYSIYNTKQKAVKGIYAGNVWNSEKYQEQINNSLFMMNHFEKENIELKPGKYRVYLAPGAVSELVGLLSWGALSYDSYRKGKSAFKDLADKKVKLSSKFSLTEDFTLGLNTKFNDLGEVAADKLEILHKGELVNLLTSSRSSKEYNVASNFAGSNEGLRSPTIATGDLKSADILKTIDTGIYLSNLHYLNWSDQVKARVTGMTRYACFWVEKGEIVAPIKDMRFDDTLYNIWGENLAAVTVNADIIPTVGSYGNRNIGGEEVPGMIINDFTLTL